MTIPSSTATSDRKAIIFDMDGVLVDSQLHWKAVQSDFLRSLIPQWDQALQQSIFGMSVYDVHAHLAEKWGLTKSREEFIAHYKSLTDEIYGVRCNIFPGVREVMEHAVSKGYRIGIASSSPRPWIEIVVDRFGLRDFIAEIISSDDVHAKTKPAPDIYVAAAIFLAAFPEKCIAVEDTAKGIESAKTAGMRCVGFRNGYNGGEDFSAADWLCAGFPSFPWEAIEAGK